MLKNLIQDAKNSEELENLIQSLRNPKNDESIVEIARILDDAFWYINIKTLEQQKEFMMKKLD